MTQTKTQTAHEKLVAILTSAGYSVDEAEMLLSSFLQEEAALYLDCMEAVEEEVEERRKSMS